MEIKYATLMTILIATFISNVTALSIHIIFVAFVTPILDNATFHITIIKPPYPRNINISACHTALVPALAMRLLYIVILPLLMFKSYISRVLILGTFVLALKGELFRQLMMNVLVGSTLCVAMLQQSQSWIITYAMSMIIALITKIDKSFYRIKFCDQSNSKKLILPIK